jgi:hypothetical protein
MLRACFNLSGYRVAEAIDGPLGVRKVVVESLEREGGCPSHGVLTARVQRFGTCRSAELLWCGVTSAALVVSNQSVREEHSPSKGQLPCRARCTARLKVALLEEVAWAGRAVLEVAAFFGVAWWMIQEVITTVAVAMANPDSRAMQAMRCDEYRRQGVARGQIPGHRRSEISLHLLPTPVECPIDAWDSPSCLQDRPNVPYRLGRSAWSELWSVSPVECVGDVGKGLGEGG